MLRGFSPFVLSPQVAPPPRTFPSLSFQLAPPLTLPPSGQAPKAPFALLCTPRKARRNAAQDNKINFPKIYASVFSAGFKCTALFAQVAINLKVENKGQFFSFSRLLFSNKSSKLEGGKRDAWILVLSFVAPRRRRDWCAENILVTKKIVLRGSFSKVASGKLLKFSVRNGKRISTPPGPKKNLNSIFPPLGWGEG